MVTMTLPVIITTRPPAVTAAGVVKRKSPSPTWGHAPEFPEGITVMRTKKSTQLERQPPDDPEKLASAVHVITENAEVRLNRWASTAVVIAGIFIVVALLVWMSPTDLESLIRAWQGR